jgi:hypothetical protein
LTGQGQRNRIGSIMDTCLEEFDLHVAKTYAKNEEGKGAHNRCRSGSTGFLKSR